MGQPLVDGSAEKLKDGCRPNNGGEQLQICLQAALFYLQQISPSQIEGMNDSIRSAMMSLKISSASILCNGGKV